VGSPNNEFFCLSDIEDTTFGEENVNPILAANQIGQRESALLNWHKSIMFRHNYSIMSKTQSHSRVTGVNQVGQDPVVVSVTPLTLAGLPQG